MAASIRPVPSDPNKGCLCGLRTKFVTSISTPHFIFLITYCIVEIFVRNEDMSRRVYDLKNDEELNTAYWEAVRGGIGGAARVSSFGLVRGLL